MSNIYLFRLIYTVFILIILLISFIQKTGSIYGEKKRLSTIIVAGLFLIPYFLIFATERGLVNFYYTIPFYFTPIIGIILLRKKIFIYKIKCNECKTNKIGLYNFFFDDKNLCSKCFLKHANINQINWDKIKWTEHAVLCFIRKEGKILLILKKRGLGKGKINAPGGKIEKGETAEQATIRETQEEVGLTPKGIKKMCDLFFVFTDGYSLHGEVFTAKDYEGTLIETDEAAPFWQDEDKIPYDKMWEDDILWLPRILNGEKIKGKFIFDVDTLLKNKIENM